MTNEKVNALMELAQLKREYQLLQEYVSCCVTENEEICAYLFVMQFILGHTTHHLLNVNIL